MAHQSTDIDFDDDQSPYHAGEKQVQRRAHVRERAEQLGRHMIRDFMPDQHRAFFEQLPYVFVASLDDERWPVATALVGRPGFLRSSGPRRLELALGEFALPPELERLRAGDAVGILGIEFHTRRRNRMNGRVVERSASALALEVDQSFGNCPQYIQARSFDSGAADDAPRAPSWQVLSNWTEEAVAVLGRADTCIVATASDNAGAQERAQGCDCSHRGGRPGFLRLERGDAVGTLTLPDFAGNRSFNTLGNLAVNPKIGILVPEFTTGRAVHVRGTAEIIWDPARVGQFQGAERLVRIAVRDVRLGKEVLTGAWSAPEWSTQLESTGSWGA